jgi:hypothetical protein
MDALEESGPISLVIGDSSTSQYILTRGKVTFMLGKTEYKYYLEGNLEDMPIEARCRRHPPLQEA